MTVYRHTRRGDVVTVTGPNAAKLDRDPLWKRVTKPRTKTEQKAEGDGLAG